MGLSYFKVYRDFIEIVRALDNGARGRLFMALLQYVNDEEPDNLTGGEKIAFLAMKGQIDRDAASYESVSQVRREAGAKGAKKRWSTEKDIANAILPQSKNSKNSICHKEKDKEEDKDKEYIPPLPPKAKKGSRFVPPTVEEVAAYCKERGNRVDPNRFVDFYTSKGWMVGKTKMKDWRACVRNWEREERPAVVSNRPAAKPGPVTYHTESSIDMDKVREFELSDVPVYGEETR